MANNTYAADLRIPMSEEVGPKLNSRTVNLLHPDMHQTSQDLGRTRITQRAADRVAYLASNLSNANNVYLKNLTKVAPDGTMEERVATDAQGNLINGNGVKVQLTEGSDQDLYLTNAYAHEVDGTTVQPDDEKVLYKNP